jgi:hypothetical protein
VASGPEQRAITDTVVARFLFRHLKNDGDVRRHRQVHCNGSHDSLAINNLQDAFTFNPQSGFAR